MPHRTSRRPDSRTQNRRPVERRGFVLMKKSPAWRTITGQEAGLIGCRPAGMERSPQSSGKPRSARCERERAERDRCSEGSSAMPEDLSICSTSERQRPMSLSWKSSRSARRFAARRLRAARQTDFTRAVAATRRAISASRGSAISSSIIRSVVRMALSLRLARFLVAPAAVAGDQPVLVGCARRRGRCLLICSLTMLKRY